MFFVVSVSLGLSKNFFFFFFKFFVFFVQYGYITFIKSDSKDI